MTVDVIIPTMGGREKYLCMAITSAISQLGVDDMIIVSNNGAHPAVRSVVENFNSDKIRYVEPPQFLSMPDHWDFALSHSTGEIVTIIGDDDALMPKTLEKVSRIFDDHPDVSAVSHNPAQYYWPDCLDVSKRNLFHEASPTGEIRKISAQDALQTVLSFDAWYGTLPYLYHGFVRRSVLVKISEIQDGSVFLRACPDIYSDFAISANIDKYIHLNDTLTIGGQGAKSNGINYALGTADGNNFISEMPKRLLPDFSARSITFHIYDAGTLVMHKFNVVRKNALSWRKFVDSACRDAVLYPDHRHEILGDLARISRSEFPGLWHFLTVSACNILKLPLVSYLLKSLLRWRERNVYGGWKNASDAGNITNVWELAQWLHQNPRA
jgi:glycosyltransferase involved in cell wall biosynthesis